MSFCSTCHSIQPDYKFLHTCTPLTCSNCFSPKEIFNRLCLQCMTSPPCFFCTNPAVYDYQGVNVCPTHLDLSCQLELDMRNHDRKVFHDNYEKVMEMQRLRRVENLRRKRVYKRRVRLSTIKKVLNEALKNPSFTDE
jgi:hypothetical protein